MQYFILTENGEEGPYDLVSMVRKVKNGTVTPDTRVRKDGQTEITPAGSTEGLAPLFLEEEEEATPLPRNRREYDLKEVFATSWNYVSLHQSVVIITGIFLMALLIGGAILGNFPLVGIGLGFVYAYVLLGTFQYFMLKRARGQAFPFMDLVPVLLRHCIPLSLAGLLLSIPVGIGLVLLLAPGLLILTFYLFTPLLIIEQKRGFWQAMEMSRKKVASMGGHNIGVLFSLLVANLFGALLLLFPLLITLPLTMHALSEIYDEQFAK